MNRNNQIIRVLKIIFKMMRQTTEVTIRQLAQEFKVHQKTIRRDLKAIASSDFSLTTRSNRGEKFFTIKEKIESEGT